MRIFVNFCVGVRNGAGWDGVIANFSRLASGPIPVRQGGVNFGNKYLPSPLREAKLGRWYAGGNQRVRPETAI